MEIEINIKYLFILLLFRVILNCKIVIKIKKPREVLDYFIIHLLQTIKILQMKKKKLV